MNEMMRDNSGKPRVSIFPPVVYQLFLANVSAGKENAFIHAVVEILDFGATKYDLHNWKKAGSWHKCADSAIRHFMKWRAGEEIDQESGLPHLAHYACNLCFLYEFSVYNTGTDDRWHGYDSLYTVEFAANEPHLSMQSLLNWLDGGGRGYLEEALLEMVEWFHSHESL